LPIEPLFLGEVVDPLLCCLVRFDGTCDCCLFEWLVRGVMVPDEPDEPPEEPDDIDGELDMLPDEVCAKAEPATSKAAAAVTIKVRIRVPYEWLVRLAWALYERVIPTGSAPLCSATIGTRRRPPR
jgi:hypothetical protein